MQKVFQFSASTTATTLRAGATLQNSDWMPGTRARTRVSFLGGLCGVGLAPFTASAGHPVLSANVVHDLGMCDPSALYFATISGSPTVTVMVDL